MPSPVVLALTWIMASSADTAVLAPRDTAVGPVMAPVAAVSLAAADTVRPRRKAVEVSEWYERRLRVHRYGSYAIYPLFVIQAVAGNQLYKGNEPSWARPTHQATAFALATVFSVNTVTGLWNLWDSRSVEEGRARRFTHTALMLASDAGFTYAGVTLSDRAKTSLDGRREHRAWAYGSMATALAGVGVMKFWKE